MTFFGRLAQMGFAARAIRITSYSDYLKSPHWREVKRSFQDCYCCGDPEEVHLHHKTYERLGEERLDDLVALCPRCHALVHVLERRGDLELDLAGLLDETRAEFYKGQRAVHIAKARAEYEETHDLSRLPREHRLRLLEARAASGESEAKRHLFMIDKHLQDAEKRLARNLSASAV